MKEASYCVICGEKNIQFHHCNPAEKVSEIGKLARLGNLPLLRAEFAKVIPLCEAHHRGTHRGHIQGYMNGTFDNGKPSSDHHALRFMPWLAVIGEPEIECV